MTPSDQRYDFFLSRCGSVAAVALSVAWAKAVSINTSYYAQRCRSQLCPVSLMLCWPKPVGFIRTVSPANHIHAASSDSASGYSGSASIAGCWSITGGDSAGAARVSLP